MNMQAITETGWVTVAKAAAELTRAGDKIDASNVSRYLARHTGIPSKKEGKYRLVDLTALAAHRNVNVFVADKQSARGIETAETAKAPLLTRPAVEPVEESDATLAHINRALKSLELRRRQREEDEADGKLVPDHEVLTLISTVMQTFTASLERQEAVIAQEYGRDVASHFRKSRKAALADASRRLSDLAMKHLPPAIAPRAVDAATSPAKMEPETAVA